MTLTEMLKEINPDDVELNREVFKEWLKEVGLPDYQVIGKNFHQFSATESLRKLLITLVDEP